METLELPQDDLPKESAPDRFGRLKVFLANNKKPLLVAGLLALAAGAWAGYQYVYLPTFSGVTSSNSTGGSGATASLPKNIPNPINGVLYNSPDAAKWQNRTPLAVVIENSLDSRPQSGLASADLVYEALAEGGITRQLALYLSVPTPTKVGPIRSIRTYFLDWQAEYQAIGVHVGGNSHALDRIGPEHFKDLDGIYIGKQTFVRTTDRLAPHNDYSGTDLLWLEAENRGYKGLPSFRSWVFKDENPTPAGDATASAKLTKSVALGFLGDPSYKVIWTYDQPSNSYLRIVGGTPFIDRNNNQQISAKTVIVQVVSYTLFPEKGALNMTDTGSGVAYVLTDGVVTTGTWHKASVADRTIFTDKAGQEISLNRGPIWVEIVPPGSPVTF